MSTSDTERDGHRERQGDLDRDQAIADLSQAVTDREQHAGDVDQIRTDERDERLEDATAAGSIGPAAATVERDTLAAGQRRRDDHQESLDDAQSGRDRHQTMLDAQQDEFDETAPTGIDDEGHDRRFRAAEERARAAEERAEAAMRRARAARARSSTSGPPASGGDA